MPISLRESIARGATPLPEDALLQSRSALLADADRDLVRAVLFFGQPTRMLARLGHTNARTIQRRVHQLLRHMQSERFLVAGRILDKLTPDQSLVAKYHICQRQTARRTAERMGTTPHRVRRLIYEVDAIVNGVIARKQASGPMPWGILP
jgi:hypothetical protein